MSIKNVIEWVNAKGKPLWWRAAVKDILDNGTLTGQHRNVLLELAKTEHLINSPDALFATKTALVSDVGYNVESEPVRLLGISNTSNVASLVQNQNLAFDAQTNLIIVYGNNGSGKSSYAKVLKNACLTRGDAPEVISNVYENTKGIPSSEINIQISDKQPKADVWVKNQASSPELKSIRVFDSKSANHYLAKKGNVEYKPAALKVLDELILVCNHVAQASITSVRALGEQTTFPQLPTGSRSAIFLQRINKDTTVEELEQNCASQVEVDSLTQLRKELAELQGSSPEDLRKKFKEQYQRLDPLINHFDRLLKSTSNEAVLTISKLFDTYKTTETAAEVARHQALGGLPVEGIGSQVWKSMWQHVEEFIKHNGQGQSFPPVAGESCPTCLQPITETTAKQLQKFNDYLKDKTQSEADAAKKNFDQAVNCLGRLNFDLTAHEGVLSWIEGSKKEVADSLRNLNADIQKRVNGIIGKPAIFQFKELVLNGLTWLKLQSENFKKKEQEVKDDAAKQTTITLLINKISDIENRSQITTNKALIQNEIKRLKQLHLLENLGLSAKISSITRKVNEIAKQGSVGKLQETFVQELKKLNFKHLEVQTATSGKAGQSMLEIKLANSEAKIPEIASEGEQKCIALAGFMAELIVDNRKSAIVFDDPVNSLDHLWREKFANRIVEESKNRQVVVLTHDLPFLKMLEDVANQHQFPISISAIRRHGKLAGYPMVEPPWEAFNTNKRIKKLKTQLPELKNQFNNPDQQQYILSAKSFYDQMRKTWERLVEEWLLKGVVERFSYGVKTQNLKYIDTIDANDNKIISDAYAKCCKHVHDTASAFGVSFPDFEELESDLTGLESYFNDLKKRREKPVPLGVPSSN
jgi:energy-coupling factor transporter ATP-binding protein EcfA2